jgi:hypothetical protein
MDIYLSPVYLLIAGLVITFIFSKVRVPIAIIAIAAIFLVVYTLYYHVSMFSTEYKVISTSEWVKSLGSTILIGAVVVLAVGYIIFFFKKDKTANAYKAYLPESQTQSWNPVASLSRSFSPNSSGVRSPVEDLSNSQRKNYISALDRLI